MTVVPIAQEDVWGDFFRVFQVRKRNPMSKFEYDQILTCQICEIWSDSIFDTGLGLPHQNTWKNSPRV